MPVEITCRNIELSSSFQDLITKKARKLGKFFDKVDRIEVIFSAEKHRRHCEIIVHAGPILSTGSAENGNEGNAFDKALKAVERQIKDSKNKMRDRRGPSLGAAMAEKQEVEEALEA